MGVPLRWIDPLKWPKRARDRAVGAPAAVAAATTSFCATSVAVAVSNPDRRISQDSPSTTQPEYIA